MRKPDANLGINFLRTGLQPGSLGLHHDSGGDDALLESQGGHTQILLCLCNIGLRHGQAFVGLIYTEVALVHLQLNEVAGLVKLQVGNGRGTLRGTHLVGHVAPVPYGNAHQQANVPADLISSAELDYSQYDLSKADATAAETVNSVKCTVYIFNNNSGSTRFFLNGNQLVRFAAYDAAGHPTIIGDIGYITDQVPADKIAPPADYTAYKGLTGLFSFISLLGDVVGEE